MDHSRLSILHCFRAPVGGLFRHVCDLVAAQAGMGHDVGVICDSRSGGETAQSALRTLNEACSLGVERVPMSRQIGLRDIAACRAVRNMANRTGARVLHGHGAKGGAYARLAARSLKRRGYSVRAFYTPHGGSLHYDPHSLKGKVFLTLERRLAPHSDGLIFESRYGAGVYETNVGAAPCETRIIPNGLRQDEFYEVCIDESAADFLFVGELRYLKGTDILLHALADVNAVRNASCIIVGNGPDERAFQSLAKRLKLNEKVQFTGAMPARAAFVRGRCLLVPSRAESFPYIVLEAAGAQMPLIATDVGGISEITADSGMELIARGDKEKLAGRMMAFLEDPKPFVEQAGTLQAFVRERFTVERMASAITGFYADLIR